MSLGRSRFRLRRAHNINLGPSRLGNRESSGDVNFDLPETRRNFSIRVACLSLSPTCFTKILPAQALSPEQASTAYDSFASNYDALDGGRASTFLGLDDARTRLLQKARGRVLEIGVGTGLNLNKYDLSKVSTLTLVDVSEGMLRQARARASLVLPENVHVTFRKADVTSQLVTAFGENSFDTVVDSFSLCVMGNDGAKRCLDQLRSVVKPKSDGGLVLLLENSRSSSPLLGWYQDITADAAASTGGKGCVYNQNVAALIQGTGGLKIEKETSYAAGLFRSFECTKVT